ncbi:hypothetical protein GDO81_006143 [Engystomops pustulosus]|uniref:Uncharacterized protein n=1 Tax=Engystomops pustulosus TaxID=76066 RepID=A0AAV7CVK5_ENGPU|nr:hypothetical protein GDO81_006143 [Engystomops pustulosus]
MACDNCPLMSKEETLVHPFTGKVFKIIEVIMLFIFYNAPAIFFTLGKPLLNAGYALTIINLAYVPTKLIFLYHAIFRKQVINLNSP